MRSRGLVALRCTDSNTCLGTPYSFPVLRLLGLSCPLVLTMLTFTGLMKSVPGHSRLPRWKPILLLKLVADIYRKSLWYVHAYENPYHALLIFGFSTLLPTLAFQRDSAISTSRIWPSRPQCKSITFVYTSAKIPLTSGAIQKITLLLRISARTSFNDRSNICAAYPFLQLPGSLHQLQSNRVVWLRTALAKEQEDSRKLLRQLAVRGALAFDSRLFYYPTSCAQCLSS